MLPLLLALAASAGYGAADFLAGRAARRLDPARLVLASQAAQGAAVVLALLWLAPARGHPPAPAALGWGALAGLANGAALVLYYRALAAGPAGVVSALATGSMAVPIAVAMAAGQLRSAAVLAGIGLVLLGAVVAVRGAPDDVPNDAPNEGAGGAAPRGDRRGYLAPALAATLAFGAFFVLIERGSAAAAGAAASTGPAGLLWVTAGVQLGALPPALLRVLWTRARPHPGAAPRAASGADARGRRGVWPAVALLSAFNLAADVALAAALADGGLAVVSALASLGPVVTGALARAVARERLSRPQLAGAALTLVGTVVVLLRR